MSLGLLSSKRSPGLGKSAAQPGPKSAGGGRGVAQAQLLGCIALGLQQGACPAALLAQGKAGRGTDVPSGRAISQIWRTWEPDLQEHHHFNRESGDWACRESRSVGPQSPVHHPCRIPVFQSPIPNLSIHMCFPAQSCFPRSPALPTCSKMAKRTQTQPGSCLHPRLGSGLAFPACLHPSLAASFACKPSPMAFPASFLALGGRPRFVLRAGLGTWWEDHHQP